ncbi:hypothetical protein [Micromonospora sp. NPDC005413]|uniref:hypothetical protein n=1 Tax=Micromonospora sp. NPDC005413 TaxID=3154563 RepID=UPI0033AEA6A8
MVAVVDAEGGVGGFDGEGRSGVSDADVDPLTCDDQGSTAADAAFDPGSVRVLGWVVVRRGGRRGCWRLRLVLGGWQAAQEDAVGGDLHEAAVESDGHAPAREVVADGVLPSGEADQASGVDEPFDLDRGAGSDGTGGNRWRPGG